MRSRNKQPEHGAVRFEVIVVVVLIATIAGILLAALDDVQNDVEHVLVDAEVMSLRTELQLVAASAINRGTQAQLAAWVGRNPLTIAGRLPAADGPNKALTLGRNWQWDEASSALVYRFPGGESVRLRIALAASESAGWALGGGLVLVAQRGDERYLKQ